MSKNPIFKDISLFLEAIGANQIQTSNNAYEVARFLVNDDICVIYSGKKGYSGNNPSAVKIINSFLNKKLINIQDEKRLTLKQKFYNKLLERDGNSCFYTGSTLTLENSSIEHLIPLSKGGKNNMDNLVLCLKEENEKMANLPLIDKVKYKIENLLKPLYNKTSSI
jgi:5-methylcytosine-specific restriction endonuclease McrA